MHHIQLTIPHNWPPTNERKVNSVNLTIMVRKTICTDFTYMYFKGILLFVLGKLSIRATVGHSIFFTRNFLMQWLDKLFALTLPMF